MIRLSVTPRFFAPALLLVASLLLTSCVTVTESRLTKKASPEKAVENYTQLGLGYLQRGRPDLARQRLQKALDIEEDYAPANDAMGLLWQTEGEFDLAEEYFRKAIRTDGSFTRARHNLGRLFSQTKEYASAESELKRASGDRYYDNRVGAMNDLALNFYRQNKIEQAIDTYGQTLRIAPYNAEALVNGSTLLFEAQRYEESLKYFDRFDRLVQREQAAHNAHSLWLGIKLLTIQQDTRRTIALATDLKRNFPDSVEYRLYQESLTGAN
ncbi:tetratricopeptide repeat protein [Venatoribacter cucullus]|uniref:tetratricopeptide repeat protein n=1 Tax=Venatoribacter cucullus TaxID=2661630 RepID=UPI00223F6670|nr:tetratricopeptide repeat protein [Venatoribacter cucullus]UZK03067.1 tetratricopeptide repeat protein [Venatoribacter cucullus]